MIDFRSPKVALYVALLGMAPTVCHAAPKGYSGITSDNLSRPVIHSPIHECATVVWVKGVKDGAQVILKDKQSKVRAEGEAWCNNVVLTLGQPFHLGETVTAIQVVDAHHSKPSDPEPVIAFPPSDELNPPEVNEQIYQCGRVVRVDKLLESGRVEIFCATEDPDKKIGETVTPNDYYWAYVNPALVKDHLIHARWLPPDDCDWQSQKPLPMKSLAKRVKPEPLPRQIPVPRKGYVGSRFVTVDRTLMGALVELWNEQGTDKLAEGYALNGSKTFKLRDPIAAGAKFTARQKLCDYSKRSRAVPAEEDLPPPSVEGPLCHLGDKLLIRNTAPGIEVVVFVRRKNETTGTVEQKVLGIADGGEDGNLIMHLGGSNKFLAEDKVFAMQHIGDNWSDESHHVDVIGRSDPRFGLPRIVSVSGKKCSGIVCEYEEGAGIDIEVKTCCHEAGMDPLSVTISTEMEHVNIKKSEVEMTEVYSGHFTGHWVFEDHFKNPYVQYPAIYYLVTARNNCTGLLDVYMFELKKP
jgi:hypothetical protein